MKIDEAGIIVRISQIDETIQRLFSRTMRLEVSYLCHHSTLDGHLGERRIDDTVLQEFY